MTKQELLDKDNPTPKEAVAQQLIMGYSMTRLKEIGRVVRELSGRLYKTSMKQLPFEEMVKAVDMAEKLTQDLTVDDDTAKPQQAKQPNVVK